MAFGGAGLARRSSNVGGSLGAAKATAREPRTREKSRREKRESAISRSSGFDRMIRFVRLAKQENASFSMSGHTLAPVQTSDGLFMAHKIDILKGDFYG